MEQNTVILDLNTYNDLRKFKEEVLDYSKVAIYGSCYYDYKPMFLTKDDAVLELAEKNERLRNENSRLTMQMKSAVEKDIEISEIKKMSIWQFLKWRKK